MPISYISEKGQILIPRQLRRKLGFKPAVQRAGTKVFLNWVNWGEFFYIVTRRVSAARAAEALRLLEQLPIESVAIPALGARGGGGQE